MLMQYWQVSVVKGVLACWQRHQVLIYAVLVGLSCGPRLYMGDMDLVVAPLWQTSFPIRSAVDLQTVRLEVEVWVLASRIDKPSQLTVYHVGGASWAPV
jgi:hypothetical protein